MFRRNNNIIENNHISFNNGHIIGGEGNDNKSNINNCSGNGSIGVGESIHPRGTNPVVQLTPQMSTVTTNHHQHHHHTNSNNNNCGSSKKNPTKNRSMASISTSVSSYISPTSIVIGVLLYIIFVQFSIIRTKDAAIFTILTKPHPAQRHEHSSTHTALLLKSRHLFNNQQYKLLEELHKQCSSTVTVPVSKVTDSVGTFPIRKPSTDIDTLKKIQQQAQIPWKPYTTTILRKISYPIFVPSLPKSGTTSIWKYFKCGHQEACHNWIQGSVRGEKPSLLGICIEKNIRNAAPPFENCGPYDVYTDSGYLNYDHDGGEKCFYPSIDGLEAIYESYPNITFVNVVRDTAAWYKSIRNWSQASLFVRLRLCNATGFPNGQSTRDDFMQMYDNFNHMIRQFVKDRPSITYIEVQLEANDTGKVLQDATGIDAACWKVCKPQERHCEGDEPKHAGRPRQKQKQLSDQQKSIQATKGIKTNGADESDEGEGGDDTEQEEEEEGNDDDEGIQ